MKKHLALVLLSACEISQTGALGRLEFSLSECGRTFCDATAPLAVNGSVVLHAQDSVDEVAQFVSDSPVVVVAQGGSSPQLVAVAPGFANVQALDASGAVIDYMQVEVRMPNQIDLTVFGTEQLSFGELIERHQAPVGTYITLTASTQDDYVPLMGQIPFAVGLDYPLALSARGDIQYGDLRFEAAPGTNAIVFTTPNGVTKVFELTGL